MYRTSAVDAQTPARLASAADSARHDAWRFTVEINGRSTVRGTPTVVDSVVIGTAVVRGRDARFDIVTSHEPEFPAGGWVVSADGGRTLLAVDPVARRFRTVPTASSEQAVNASKFVSIAVTGLVVRGDTLGDCGTVDGHPTTCYRLTRDYVISQRYFFVRRTAKIHEEIRFWVASDLPNIENPVARFFTESSAYVFDAPDNVMRARRTEANLFGGTLLKVEISASEADTTRPMRGSTVVTSVEARSFERVTVDPSRFEIPAGYRMRKP